MEISNGILFKLSFKTNFCLFLNQYNVRDFSRKRNEKYNLSKIYTIFALKNP